MKIISSYLIISSKKIVDLDKKVRDKVNNHGYELQGGVNVLTLGNSFIYHQALVKYDRSREMTYPGSSGHSFYPHKDLGLKISKDTLL